MSEDRLGADIRAAFDSTHVPSPGLEDRVIAAIPWARKGMRSESPPRLAGVAAALLAVAMIVVLATPTLLSRLGLRVPGSSTPSITVAYSLAGVEGSSVFVVQRGLASQAYRNGVDSNVLLVSKDGGRSWVTLLQFAGVYDGMQVYGSTAFVWSIDMQPQGCATNAPCTTPPTEGLNLYRSTDGGATWRPMPRPTFPVADVFFIDSTEGWAVSESPTSGLNSAVLYRTADAGQTWSRIGALPSSSPMAWVYGVGNYRVTFSRNADGTLTGWYVGQGDLFVTRDMGLTWRPASLAAPATVAGWTMTPAQPVFSGSEGILVIAYRNPSGPDNATADVIYLYTSHDGGATWGDPRPAPAGFMPVGDVLSPTILDPRHVWLSSLSLTGGDNVQAGPAVARTTDAGQTWSVFHKSPRILTMGFSDAAHGFALDVTGASDINGIIATSDGGATWHRVTPGVVG
jgi:photosystem II stability/assembly factor-like uncharacterized protein